VNEDLYRGRLRKEPVADRRLIPRDVAHRFREDSEKGPAWVGIRIDDRQNAKRPPVREGIMHKIHAPPFGWADRHRSGPAMQGHVFASPHPHPQLKPIQSVQPTDPLPIHEPPFPPE